ncbi:amidase domain-containing protein [Bacillus sp. FSL W7-1360]
MEKQVVQQIHARAQMFMKAWMYGDERMLIGKEERLIPTEKEVLSRRQASVVHAKVSGEITSVCTYEARVQVDYVLLLERFIIQQEGNYIEERLCQRRALFVDGEWQSDDLMNVEKTSKYCQAEKTPQIVIDAFKTVDKSYDRREAVRYAERWWQGDTSSSCAHFVSQCLYAGGAPMTDTTERHGWWSTGVSYGETWSNPHLLRWYLSGATKGLCGEMRTQAKDLLPGDVICYDFNGDGVWDHVALVVAKDVYGEPLVNAHHMNSRMRYWTYEDAAVYTNDTKYVFFHIVVN